MKKWFLVEFPVGKFGVARETFLFKNLSYLSLYTDNEWKPSDGYSSIERYCSGTKEEAEARLKRKLDPSPPLPPYVGKRV